MAALPPRYARRRARPGSLERPVSGRLYRGTWLLVGIPLLAAAFSVHKVEPLPAPQDVLPASFDRFAAVEVASQLAHLYPDRMPGTAGAAGAADFVRQQLAPYGLKVVSDRFRADLPGHGEETLENQTVTVPGRSPDEIVVMAHRDDNGTGPGANDNASGIAALIQLARSYGSPEGSRPVSPLHTLVFVATDGGAFGALGAKRFAERHRGKVVAALDLTALASRGPPRVVLAGTEPRLASPGLVETAAERVLEQAGRRPAHPGWLGQLIDLAFPFTLYAQGPLLAHGLPALTLTSGSERPPASFPDQPSRLNGVRLAQLGRAAQQILRWFDSGAELAPGTAAYVYFGPRVLPGWAIELVLIAALVPFMVATVDLFARCRRRHIKLAPALRSYRSRFGFWLWVAIVFELFALLGFWPAAPSVPLPLDAAPATDWPVFALIGLVILSVLGWLVTRARLVPRRAVSASEELAGTTAALLSLGVIALLVLATNPFALVFLLPSLHAWLWLPHYRGRPLWARAALLAAGFLGPLLLLGSFGLRYHLGLDAPWYLAELTAAGYVKLPAVVIAVGWLAAAGQVAALAAGRYAPYPSASERPPRGPLREAIRRVVLTVRNTRKHTPESERRALEA
jgi:peptidase M28-like protein